MDKQTFSPYIVSPSALLTSYASSSSSAIPSIEDLLALQSELQAIQGDFADRKAKLRSDEEKLKLWKTKGKGKEKERPNIPTPVSSIPQNAPNGVNTHHADNKALQRMIREGSGACISLVISINTSV